MSLSASWSNESISWTTDMENYSEDTEANKSKKQSRRSDVVKRMMSAYKKKKRKEKIEKLASDDNHWSGLSWSHTSRKGVCLPPYFGSQSINLYPRARVLILGLKKHPTGGITAHETHSPRYRTHHGKILITRRSPRVTYLKRILFIAIASFLSLPAQSQSLIDNFNSGQQLERERKRVFSKNLALVKRCDKLFSHPEIDAEKYLHTICVNDNYVVSCLTKYPKKLADCDIAGVIGRKTISQGDYAGKGFVQWQITGNKIYIYACPIDNCTSRTTIRNFSGELRSMSEARRVSNYYTNDIGVEFADEKPTLPTIVDWDNWLTEAV